jgi:hypothetical protein
MSPANFACAEARREGNRTSRRPPREMLEMSPLRIRRQRVDREIPSASVASFTVARFVAIVVIVANECHRLICLTRCSKRLSSALSWKPRFRPYCRRSVQRLDRWVARAAVRAIASHTLDVCRNELLFPVLPVISTAAGHRKFCHGRLLFGVEGWPIIHPLFGVRTCGLFSPRA